MVFLSIIMTFTVSIVTNVHTWPDLTPVLMPYSTHLDQNHFLMMEIVTWNIPLSNGKTENSLLGVWFWGSLSHFRSRPFVTGSYNILLSSVHFGRGNHASVWWRGQKLCASGPSLKLIKLMHQIRIYHEFMMSTWGWFWSACVSVTVSENFTVHKI